MHLGLVAHVEGETSGTREVQECRRVLDAYARRFQEFHGGDIDRSVANLGAVPRRRNRCIRTRRMDFIGR